MLLTILLIMMLLAAAGIGYQVGVRRGWELGRQDAQDDAIVAKMIEIMQRPQ